MEVGAERSQEFLFSRELGTAILKQWEKTKALLPDQAPDTWDRANRVKGIFLELWGLEGEASPRL